jgi:hypothetical protein
MIAAVYARKATDQSGVSDEQRSVARQVHARSYAARKGWGVLDEHVYVDDGISGAEFANRPGFLRPDELTEAASVVSGTQHVRGVTARPRSDRDRVRAQATRAGWRARVLLPRGPRAHARLADRQDHVVTYRGGGTNDEMAMSNAVSFFESSHLSVEACSRRKLSSAAMDGSCRCCMDGGSHVGGGSILIKEAHFREPTW